MAVYKRNYQRYEGRETPGWSRFLIVPRFAFREVFSSKWVTALFVIGFLPVLVFGALIYVRHSVAFVEIFDASPRDFFAVNGEFFLIYWAWQGSLSFFLTAIIGPGLIAPDLANNALPLYLCRPFSRIEYVLGKMVVLSVVISALTWIPGLLLMVMHSGYEGWGWMIDNIRLPIAMVLTGLTWMLILSLMALSLSAWVKWRPVAGALLFAIFFVSAAFSGAINLVLFTRLGDVFNLPQLLFIVMTDLFLGKPILDGVPVSVAWILLALTCVLFIWLLNRRIRAYEVVR